jgi:phosphoribosylformylglycinamidine cyclo-ligase
MAKKQMTYAGSGVDIDKKDAFTESLDSMLRKTFTPRVMPNPGGFAGLFRLDYNRGLFSRNYKDPVLVACCDGVGTKIKLAAELKKFDTIGIDLVAMNVNDLIVQGAEPLFFLDYIATPAVDTAFLNDLVKGISDGCRQSGCALIGGETANMPDLYKPGDFDLAGFCVGVVELKRIKSPTRVRAGDVVLGLRSDGIHSNGYTLVRSIVKEAKLDLHKVYPELHETARAVRKAKKATSQSKKRPVQAARTLGEVLLTPTRLYAEPIIKLQSNYRVKNVVSGMAHITGSGIGGNLCRALPPDLDAHVDLRSWQRPAVFDFLQKHGNVTDEEMYRVFNLGIGYCLIVRPTFAESIKEQLEKLGETVNVIGKVVKGTGQVIHTSST